MDKLYVKVKVEKDIDGKLLQTLETFESEVKGYSYLIFLDNKKEG